MNDVMDPWLEKYIENLDKRLETLDSKVDELLKFRWQIISGSVVLSVIFTILVQIVGLWVQNQNR